MAGARGRRVRGTEGGVTVGGVGQFGIGGRHPAEELAGVGGVAGAFVEIGQDVPLADMTVARVAEVAGRAGGGEDFDRRVQLALVGQVGGQDHAALGQDVGRGGTGAQLVPEGGHPTVAVQRPVAVHHDRQLAGVVTTELTGRLQVADGLGPAAEAVADQAVQLPGRG